jgi:uncharacterized membrane protein
MAEKNPLKALLLGNWLGHPLHPAIVHVPIALWLGALLFDVLTLCGVGGNALVLTSYWAIAIGLLSTLLVVPAGIAEWTEIKPEKPAWRLALWHMILNLVVAALLAVSLYFRSGGAYHADRVPMAAFALTVVANGILMVSGYLGGRMVYQHGVGVARMSKKKWRALAAAGHANLPADH